VAIYHDWVRKAASVHAGPIRISSAKMLRLLLLLAALAAAAPPPPPSACAAALGKDCQAAHNAGLTQCIACVQTHDKDLTAAGCTAVEKESYCAHPGPPPPPPPTPHRPQDSPCVTWQHASCRDLGPAGAKVSDYLPAIYTAWQWEGAGNKTNPSGRCVPCSGHPNDFVSTPSSLQLRFLC